VDAKPGEQAIIFACEIVIEQEVLLGGAGQPAIAADFLFELSRAPARIAQRHERPGRSPSRRDSAQYVDGGRKAKLVGDRNGGLHLVVRRMQHETAAAIDRASVPYDEVTGGRRQADRLCLVKNA